MFKQIGVLSGGERNRYALARMLMNPSNFLLLDEPTNHLDMRAKDVLLRALQNFTGTVVFVSHDRYFLEELATRVVEVGGGEVHSFPGSYKEFAVSRNGHGAVNGQVLAVKPKLDEAVAIGPAVAEPVKTARLNPIKLRQMKERLGEIEEEVERLETEIADCEHALGAFQSVEHSVQMNDLLQARRADLESVMAEWERVSQTVEENA